jgi:hypothetical protein
MRLIVTMRVAVQIAYVDDVITSTFAYGSNHAAYINVRQITQESDYFDFVTESVVFLQTTTYVDVRHVNAAIENNVFDGSIDVRIYVDDVCSLNGTLF